MYSAPIFEARKDNKYGFLIDQNTYTWEMEISNPVNMSRMFVGLTGYKITFNFGEQGISSLKDISCLVHAITSTTVNNSNNADDTVYELLSNLKNYYTTY
jgi:hypothetical protein